MFDLTSEAVSRFHEEFARDTKNIIARNAVANNPVDKVAVDPDAASRMRHTFSHRIDDWKVCNQEKSGRCWIFAGLNTLRIRAAKKMKLKDFELSQAYTMFWDKLEKANHFLESIIETADEEIRSRIVMWLLDHPISDGGQWHMFTNLIRKYGVVPKDVMPETFNSSNSQYMNRFITLKLREDALTLRDMHKKGLSNDALRERKTEMMSEIYRMLAIHLGEPPTKFDWEYKEEKDDKNFYRDSGLTPIDFYNKYIGVNPDDYACLINSPTTDKPYKKLYTVRFLGNVIGGEDIKYLNIDIETMKAAAAKQITDGEPVWFGCDVGKMSSRESGILDPDMYNFELLYGTKFKLDKAGRLDYGDSRMTHAMVFTGVDIDNGKPIRWRVENSWGEKIGNKGFFTMSDHWFNEYMYEVVVQKKYIPGELLPVLETEPIVLPPWDPMGSLAL